MRKLISVVMTIVVAMAIQGTAAQAAPRSPTNVPTPDAIFTMTFSALHAVTGAPDQVIGTWSLTGKNADQGTVTGTVRMDGARRFFLLLDLKGTRPLTLTAVGVLVGKPDAKPQPGTGRMALVDPQGKNGPCGWRVRATVSVSQSPNDPLDQWSISSASRVLKDPCRTLDEAGNSPSGEPENDPNDVND